MYTKSTLHWGVLLQSIDFYPFVTTAPNGMNVAGRKVGAPELAVVDAVCPSPQAGFLLRNNEIVAPESPTGE